MTRLASIAALVGTLGCLGCANEVHIRIVHSDDLQQECDLVIQNMQSFYVRMEREEGDDVRYYPKCIESLAPAGVAQPQNIAELEALLAKRLTPFEEIPGGGSWTVWIEGFITPECQKGSAPLMCGRESRLGMPPPGDSFTIHVSCVAPGALWPDGKPRRFWVEDEFENCYFK